MNYKEYTGNLCFGKHKEGEEIWKTMYEQNKKCDKEIATIK